MTTSPLLPLTAADLPPLAPELVLIGSAFALMILDLFVSNRNKIVTHLFSLAALAVVLFMLATGVGGQGEVFHGMFVRDTAADVMKTGIVLLSGLTLVYGWRYLRDRDLFQGEIPVLILFGTAGMMILVSAGSLLMVYLGLELLALCSYALVASNRESGLASEAAMKYIVLGSLASGLLLYGMSLIYGATGSLHLDVIREAIPHSEERVLLITGAVFMIAGVAFKLGAAPFHMWLPDVYQGAPAPIALFISSAPKLAAFGMAYRLLEMGVGPLSTELQLLIAGLAAVSLVIGNLMAIAQSNLKRMLAFSTVSHIGFLLMGIAGGGSQATPPRCSTHWPTRSCPPRPSARSSRCRVPALKPRTSRTSGPERPQPVDGRPGAVHHGVAGRHPAVPGLLDQAGGAGRGRQRRPAVAGHPRRAVRRGRLLLLPARHQGHVLR